MRIKIGHTLDGSPSHIDTAHAYPYALVGEQGCGKTTTARYIARWWTASHPGTVAVFASELDEWSDLTDRLGHLSGPRDLAELQDGSRTSAAGLVIVDGVDDLDPLNLIEELAVAHTPGEHQRGAARGDLRLIVTGTCAAIGNLRLHNVRTLALYPPLARAALPATYITEPPPGPRNTPAGAARKSEAKADTQEVLGGGHRQRIDDQPSLFAYDTSPSIVTPVLRLTTAKSTLPDEHPEHLPQTLQPASQILKAIAGGDRRDNGWCQEVAQGRLDWPDNTTPVLLDERGPRDQPPHPWMCRPTTITSAMTSALALSARAVGDEHQRPGVEA